jgi:pimeloyl-ACP methyl ester carboxylesterase
MEWDRRKIMAWVYVGKTDIYYLEEGQGHPFVFIHGAISCSQTWFQQFEAFRDRFRVIAYDSVNHGYSSNSPRDEEEPDRADELEGFLEALGIERPILAGNSMGAATLLRWALRHPDGAAALIPSGAGVGDGTTPPRRAEPQPISDDVLFLSAGYALTDRFRTEQPLLHQRYIRVRSTGTRLEAQRHPRRPASATAADRAVMHERIGSVRSPMLIIMGSLDGSVPAAERLHKAVPHSEYAVIEGAPHNVYYEAAAQ